MRSKSAHCARSTQNPSAFVRLCLALFLQNAGLNIFLMLRQVGSKFVTVGQRSKNRNRSVVLGAGVKLGAEKLNSSAVLGALVGNAQNALRSVGCQ
jgi:hypothetical protein